MEKCLRLLKEEIQKSGNKADLDILNELLNEETDAGSVGVAMANTTIAGMGSVVNSQPSALPGALNGSAWISGGGSEGSGDVSVPYNPGGGNRVFQKIAAPTGNKKSKKVKKSKKSKKNPNKSNRLMKFSDFEKENLNKVTYVKQ